MSRQAPARPRPCRGGGPAIVVEGFRKTYGDVVAVDGIDFVVAQGEVFGLLGPNGAGKTTTLECLEGCASRRRARCGCAASTLARAAAAARRHGRAAADLRPARDDAGGRGDALLLRVPRVEPRWDLLERFGLQAKLRVEYGTLSTGQQRRLALALALAHDPPVVFLDEPTAGLDVATRAELHALVGELRERGVALVLATHDMAEAEKLADRVAILLAGRIVATARRGRSRRPPPTSRACRCAPSAGRSALAQPLPGVRRRLRKDGYDVSSPTRSGPPSPPFSAALEDAGDPLVDLRVERPSLEERFLELTAGRGQA
jgi:ABC-2 type transport system ATP-binding protein